MQEEIPPASGSSAVTGVIPRTKDTPEQLAFAQEVAPDTVMMDYYRAERRLSKGETAADCFAPTTTVILTTTFEDERLELWFLDREIEVAVEFGADVVVPCDCPVYNTDPRLQRRMTIETYVQNLRRAIQEFDEYGIDVVPLVKGETPAERRLCYDFFEEVGITNIAYYCAQYFLYGFKMKELKQRVRDIDSEFDPANMLLIGFQSENYLPQFPPTVAAVAGHRWFRQSELADERLAVAQRNYADWERRTEKALRGGQTALDSFVDYQAHGDT